MRESRVIALAGVFQSCALARQIATQGRTDPAYMEASLSSIFQIDAASAAAAFGGIANVRFGLESMIAQIDGSTRDLALTQMVISVLRIERRLMRRADMRDALRHTIETTQRQIDHLGITHPTITARLSELYTDTLSHLRPRVVIHGNPLYLTQTKYVEQVRALLLAAVRAAVLWRQVGGSQLRLLFRRREYAMLARGLLARCALDLG